MQEDIERFLKLTNKLTMRNILLPILIILLFPVFNSCEENNDNHNNLTATDYDGNVYITVQIGNQIWMAENLKTTHYANGEAIQLVEDGKDWVALEYSDKAMCYYDNSYTNKAKYGALYTYTAAMNGSTNSVANPNNVQGVCPNGWHLPSDDEWKELEMYLGMNQSVADMYNFRGTNEGSKLAGNSSLWINGDLESDIEFGSSGFNALPGGYRPPYSEIFSQLGDIAEFWSSTESGDTLALTRLLHTYNTRVNRFTISKKDGHSVRCIKD